MLRRSLSGEFEMENWQIGLAVGVILMLVPVVYALAMLLVHSFLEVIALPNCTACCVLIRGT